VRRTTRLARIALSWGGEKGAPKHKKTQSQQKNDGKTTLGGKFKKEDGGEKELPYTRAERKGVF